MQPTGQSIAPFSRQARLGLLILWLGASALLFVRDHHLHGPFVFFDEGLYFNLARSLWEEHDFAEHKEYNPLYSLALAPLFALPSIEATYAAARALNCLLWAFAAIPIFLIARRFLPGHGPPVLVSIACVFGPLSVTSSVLWADALYYPLLALSVHLLLSLLEAASPRRALTLGLCSGALYMAKQVGMVFVLCAILTILHHFFVEGRWRSGRRYLTVFLATLGACTLPWLIRNLTIPGAGLIGYGGWAGKVGASLFSARLMEALLVNASFLVAASFFIVAALFVLEVVHLRVQEAIYRDFLVFSTCFVLCILVLASGITLVIPEQEGSPIVFPAGRYVMTVFPYLLTAAAVALLRKDTYGSRQRLLLICVVFSVILFLYSPLRAITAKSTHDAPDLSIWAYVFFDGRFFWDYPRQVTIGERLALALLPFVSLAALEGVRRVRYLFMVVVLFCVSGITASTYLSDLPATFACMNQVAMLLVQRNVPTSAVAFDRALGAKATPFGFWLRHMLFRGEMKTVDPASEPIPTTVSFLVTRAELPMPRETTCGGLTLYRVIGGRLSPAATSAGPIQAQDRPLRVFAQDLQTPVKRLTLKRGSRTFIPVRVVNPGPEPWGLAGKFPIVLSYAWLSNGVVLPIEGQRTTLTKVYRVGESEEIQMLVQAPSQGDKLELVISLVQEGVVWFFTMPGCKSPHIPVTLE